jgi:RHS repeat-associated protein
LVHHSLAWSYDANGRVVSKTQIVGSLTRSISYSYTNGNLTSILTPSGQAIAYGYSNGRIASVYVNGAAVLGGVLYEPFGEVRQWSWGNNSVAVRTHDLDGNISQIDSGGDFYGVGRDDAFRITSISNSSNSALSWTYGYDLNDRLTSATNPLVNRTWTYDANGNRTAESGSTGGVPLSSTFTLASTSNRLSSVSGSRANSYSYDAAGHTQTESNAGRPIAAVGTTTTTYVYNALSQRVAKTSSAGSRYFFYDEAGHLVGEYGSDGSLIEETVWMGDVPVATIRPRTGAGVDVYYVHTDQLNAPRKVTRPSDNVIVWRWDPNPFGDSLPDENPQGTGTFQYNLRFPGQYYDVESGLSYNYFRDYDASVGRYIESDPLGLKAGINTYSYVSGDPLGESDPFGAMGHGGNPPPGERVVPGSCGSGWSHAFVPEDFRGLVTFTEACKKHDDCYGRCGSSKAKCDNQLRDDMRSACRKVYLSGGLHFGLGDCYDRADIYYTAVTKLGQGPFDEAQKSCKCTR